MRRAAPLPLHLRRASFRAAGAGAQVSAWRLRGRDLARPFHGVRSHDVDLADPLARCLAYSQRMLEGHALSHSSAALIYRVPLPSAIEHARLVHESAAHPLQPTRAHGTVGHRHPVDAPPFRQFRGYRVTDPATTWCQLALQLSHHDLVAAGDFLISGRVTEYQREPPLSSIEELTAAVSRWRGRPGYPALARALPRLSTRVDSRQETHLRLTLVDSGLPEPVVNVPIFEGGKRLGKPDLAYPWARVVFEYQGIGHSDPVQFRRDIHRRESFEAHKQRVILVVADDLTAGKAAFLARVNEILAQQALTWPNLRRPER